MPMTRYKPEQIVTLLRQIEVEIANGKTTPQACKEAEITIQTFYRWRKEFGGLKLDQAKRLKELEKENSNLRISRRETSKPRATSDGRRARVPATWDERTAHVQAGRSVVATQRYQPMYRTDEMR
jgi:putative transposase